MSSNLESFKDILASRRQEFSNFMWISRILNTRVAYKRLVKPTPLQHKLGVLNSIKIQEIIDKINFQDNTPKESLIQQISRILDEIGYEKQLSVIRWLGLVLTKLCTKVCSGIYVQEEHILKVKNLMGTTPVIFLPSHRSYADFILMSYVCFTYNIEIPAIAAGMDFYKMWGMGSILRNTGAFFMRRSFNDDKVYWETFEQYIHQIVTKGDLPIEFFIEGTRSRSCKSLTPKNGLLNMVLKPFFNGEVPDILFVPINICYDRVLEEKLFAFELLGVPKPKESTSAFIKSLKIINESYGNIYIDFAEPISAKQFYKDSIDRSVHSIKPLHLEELTAHEKLRSSLLAYSILHTQQKHCVITTFNLLAVVLLNNFVSSGHILKLDDIIEKVVWFDGILKQFKAFTDLRNSKQNVLEAIKTHNEVIQLLDDGTISLVQNCVNLTNVDCSKLKGHNLSQETMNTVVPYIMLQIYVNPVLHYLINSSFVVVILSHYAQLNIDDLRQQFYFLRSAFSQEFVIIQQEDNIAFEDCLKTLTNLKLLIKSDDNYCLAEENKLNNVFANLLQPFLLAYYVVYKTLQEQSLCEEKYIITKSQAELETIINGNSKNINPYCLNLDSLSICLNNLAAKGSIRRIKKDGLVYCEVNLIQLTPFIDKIEPYLDLDLISILKQRATGSVFYGSKL